jgi:Raf kinase inhibitor-like YbhB/YbcL family protein
MKSHIREEVGYMKLISPAFEPQGVIPKEYTCQGSDINPPLLIEDIPSKARTLALIVDDPDAPMGTFVHWVLYDMPITKTINKNSAPGTQGINDFQRIDYGGPCPPSGTHRYFFKLYALDKKLDLLPGVKKQELEQIMHGHILDQAQLMGHFAKNGSK